MSFHDTLDENRNASPCEPIDAHRRALYQAGWSLCESCVWGRWEVTIAKDLRRIVVRARTAVEAWYRAAVQARQSSGRPG